MNSPRKIVALLVFLQMISACTGYRMEHTLSNVEGVAEVKDYLVYEGTISATITLDNGGLVWMHDIRAEQIVDTDTINILQMGNVFIHCKYPGQVGSTSSGHNIIEIASQLASETIASSAISSIPELIENYREVLALIDSLPIRGGVGARITFKNRRPTEWECFKVPQEDP